MADIDQTGDNNVATIEQDSETSFAVNTSTIEQTEDRNVAISRQFDDGQISIINQTSDSNIADVTQGDEILAASDLSFDNDSVVNQGGVGGHIALCLLYTSPSPRDATLSRMPSSA